MFEDSQKLAWWVHFYKFVLPSSSKCFGFVESLTSLLWLGWMQQLKKRKYRCYSLLILKSYLWWWWIPYFSEGLVLRILSISTICQSDQEGSEQEMLEELWLQAVKKIKIKPFVFLFLLPSLFVSLSLTIELFVILWLFVFPVIFPSVGLPSVFWRFLNPWYRQGWAPANLYHCIVIK